MIIYIDDSDHSEKEIDNLFNNNQIAFTRYDNVYWATCAEEISQAIDCSDLLQEDKTFYDIVGDESGEILYSLTDELYNAKETNGAFQELAETAQLIVNKKIYKLTGGNHE